MTNEEKWITFTTYVLKECMKRCGTQMMKEEGYTPTEAGTVIGITLARVIHECRAEALVEQQKGRTQ